jgi:hypothetical protein
MSDGKSRIRGRFRTECIITSADEFIVSDHCGMLSEKYTDSGLFRSASKKGSPTRLLLGRSPFPNPSTSCTGTQPTDIYEILLHEVAMMKK